MCCSPRSARPSDRSTNFWSNRSGVVLTLGCRWHRHICGWVGMNSDEVFAVALQVDDSRGPAMAEFPPGLQPLEEVESLLTHGVDEPLRVFGVNLLYQRVCESVTSPSTKQSASHTNRTGNAAINTVVQKTTINPCMKVVKTQRR